jgi:organic radical activating enzyme
MHREHFVKALLIYPEFQGCPFNCEFCDLALLFGEGKVSLLL